ncbi:hypothetical protein [Streptomyces sp. BBFR109]|uniref:hypothetical protein n=1 Tax=Streptomyces sp. BBFR109 TaxID=3448172 RepID=UPI003F764B50
MEHGTDPTPEQPTPVADDAHASSTQLLARAATDYATAQDRCRQLADEDRVHGNEIGRR